MIINGTRVFSDCLRGLLEKRLIGSFSEEDAFCRLCQNRSGTDSTQGNPYVRDGAVRRFQRQRNRYADRGNLERFSIGKLIIGTS